MKIELIVLSVLVSVVVAPYPGSIPEKCKRKNEIFTKCGSCEPTCDKPKPGICPDHCVVGCQCIKGYYRNKKWDCVKLNECPKEHNKCKKKNEIFTKCGSSCEPSCDKPYPTGCPKKCVIGCQCIKGYYRNKRGECVKLNECPKASCSDISCRPGYFCKIIKGKPECIKSEHEKCKKKNEIFTKCGTACEPSCDKPYPTICTLQCVIGCQCIKGYYRNKKGDCVKLSECPKASCSDISCRPGYFCKIIKGKPECIKSEHEKCKKKNEIFTKCGSACEPSCDKPYPTICTKQCVIGCQCIKGYYRNKKGDCVKLNECPKASCSDISCRPGYICKIIKGKPECIKSVHDKCKKKNEIFTKCGSACEPSCDKPNPTCYKNCVIGCQCSKGYYRNRQGECVKWHECSKVICAKSCRKGYICKVIKGRPECIPIKYQKSTKRAISCANIRCSTPGGCAMVIPQGCVYGNCVAQPMCVDKNPCSWMNCSPGKKCVLRQVVCVRAPCNPIPECVNVAPYGHPKCGINEHLVPCKGPCSEMRCGQKEPLFCPAICSGPGCACKTGYFRNTSGKCVTKKECGK